MCKHHGVYCIDSREREGIFRVRRYRCNACRETFSTTEIQLDESNIHKDGNKIDYIKSTQKQLSGGDKLLQMLTDVVKEYREYNEGNL